MYSCFTVGGWVLRCMGFTYVVSYPNVLRMVNVWKNMRERDMPTIHVFEKRKLVVVSITSRPRSSTAPVTNSTLLAPSATPSPGQTAGMLE